MNKILVLKNDRVGDLANSLKGINSLLNENSDKEIEIVLSDISKDLSFLNFHSDGEFASFIIKS